MEAEVGAIFEGKITGLTDFGAFVELENGKTGMVHISEVASSFVKNIREHLSVNQTVKVKVISISDTGKINLSIKRAQENVESGGSGGSERPPVRPSRPPRQSNQNVWQGVKQTSSGEPQSFEDMMAKFKQVSDEKITDLKRASDFKHGSYSRRGSGGK